jgi:hypothetical protein
METDPMDHIVFKIIDHLSQSNIWWPFASWMHKQPAIHTSHLTVAATKPLLVRKSCA